MNMMPQSARPVMTERRVTLLGALLVAVGPISMALYTPAMPEIVRAFGTTDAAVKLTLSLYFAGFAFAQLFCGPLSDGFGRRPITIAFMVIYLAASVAALLSPSIEILIAARFMQGIGAAVGMAISRAIVRDLFTHESSARIMSTIGMVLAVGPAFSPAIGGITMQLFGWHAIFVLMAAFGVAIVLAVVFSVKETVARDLSRIRPRAILRSYGSLLSSPYFLSTSMIMGGSVGALYTLATVLPFILIDRVGLTPVEFGLGMLMQSGSYFIGSLVARLMMGRFGSTALVPIGVGFIATGSIALCILMHVMEPTFWNVMGPVGLYAFGIAFIMPAISTASLAPFPHIAGAASSLSGFFQMSAGLVGSVVIAAFGDPVVAISIVIPAMGFVTFVCWAIWRSLPEPRYLAVPPADLPPTP